MVSIAEQILLHDDPYQSSINRFEIRTYDRYERTVTFVFTDESRLVFDITYEVRPNDQR